MKITAKNLNEKWDEIKHLMPKSITETATGKLEFADLYEDLDEESREEYDTWLKKVNEVLEKSEKKDDKPKDTKKKDSPKDKKDKPKKDPKEPKEPKPKKSQVGEKPNWLKTLESFVKSIAGKEKDTWRVRDFVLNIQYKFNKKLGNKTPNIELIKDIQDKLLKYANSDEKKVTIPEYADLVAKCKKAIKEKDFTVSTKMKKSDVKTEDLSGLKKK